MRALSWNIIETILLQMGPLRIFWCNRGTDTSQTIAESLTRERADNQKWDKAGLTRERRQKNERP
jgi:hypothetical protein